MKNEKIKPLPVVTAFTNYFIGRAKRVLKIKNSEFKSVSLDISTRSKNIWVWFHGDGCIVARAEFDLNGQVRDMLDNRVNDAAE